MGIRIFILLCLLSYNIQAQQIPFGTGAINYTYTTWSPIYKGSNITLSNSNYTATNATGTSNCVVSVNGKSTAFYCEVEVVYGFNGVGSGGTGGLLGVAINQSSVNTANYAGYGANGWAWFGYGSGPIYHNTTYTGSYGTQTAGSVIGIYYDGAGNVFMWRNGLAVNGGVAMITSGLSGNVVYILAGYIDDQYIINGNPATQLYNVSHYPGL